MITHFPPSCLLGYLQNLYFLTVQPNDLSFPVFSVLIVVFPNEVFVTMIQQVEPEDTARISGSTCIFLTIKIGSIYMHINICGKWTNKIELFVLLD